MSSLFIVGTPIGNMEDITLRALKVLSIVEVIACEDTRVTTKLLKYHELPNKKLISYHDHNEKNSAKGIVKLIQENKSVAIVSDAGMPLISDPGFEVVREAIKNNIKIEIIPGPSSIIVSLILSNFDTHFKFLGFLKPKSIQRQNQLKKLSHGTYVSLVSPHKLMDTLLDIKEIFGPEINVFLGRELTKIYESHYRGTIIEAIEQVKDKVKGEFTLTFEVKKRKANKYAK